MNVAICIITYQRPEGLKRLINGLNQLTFNKYQHPKIEIILVDNDIEGSASNMYKNLKPSSKWLINYYIEPRRGIPFARNKAILSVRANTDFIAFIDDDEVPEPTWLDELLYVQQLYKAEVVSGPVIPYFKEPAPTWITQGKLFERSRYSTGYCLPFTATNNVLIHSKVFRNMKKFFDERLALTGGSDTHFFMRVHRAGFKIVWANDALVYEWIPASKANAKWILQRTYRTRNTFTMCMLEFDSSMTVRVSRIAKGVGRIVQGLLFIAPSLLGGRSALIKALQYIYGGAGTLSGVIGKRYEEYKTIHQV